MPFDGTLLPEKALKLMRALDLLRRDGWCQNNVKNEKENHCILGAVYVAEGVKITVGFENSSIYHIMDTSKSLSLQGILNKYKFSSEVHYFNDAPGTTFADVENWFEQRIAAEIAGVGATQT